MTILIKDNFDNSLKQILLQNIGLKPNETIYKEIFKLELSKVLLVYFNQRKKIPLPAKRNVHYSEEFYNNPNYKTYETAINKIALYFEQGLNIYPFLSKTVKNIYLPNKRKDKDKDMLLNDWGIHHLHLGELKDGSEFVERTRDVLFCKITDTDVYFIGIFDHKKKETFADIDILRILKNNWENFLEPYELKNVTSLVGAKGEEIKLTSKDYIELRKDGSTTIYEVDGKFYFSPTGGYATSCHSINDVRAADDIMIELNAIKEALEGSKNSLYQLVFKAKKRKQKQFLFNYISSSIECVTIKDYYSNMLVKFIRNDFGFEYMDFILDKYVIRTKFNYAENNIN